MQGFFADHAQSFLDSAGLEEIFEKSHANSSGRTGGAGKNYCYRWALRVLVFERGYFGTHRWESERIFVRGGSVWNPNNSICCFEGLGF